MRGRVTRLAPGAVEWCVVEHPDTPPFMEYPARYAFQKWERHNRKHPRKLNGWERAHGYSLFTIWMPYESVPWLSTLTTYKILDLIDMDMMLALAKFRELLETVERDEIEELVLT